MTCSFACGKFSKKDISAKHMSFLFCWWKVSYDARSILFESRSSTDIPAPQKYEPMRSISDSIRKNV